MNTPTTVVGRQRRMPAESVIRAHWAPILWERKGYMSAEDFKGETGCCFACGYAWGGAKALERAHLMAVCVGGSDDVSNLHMLCHECHKASEHLTTGRPEDLERYWKWFYARTPCDVAVTLLVNHGYSFTQVLGLHPDLSRFYGCPA